MSTPTPSPSNDLLIVQREYGPFDDKPANGVTHDGQRLWVGSGDRMHAVDPSAGEVVRTLPLSADAGTAFDGTHLYQLTGDQIQVVELETGEVQRSIPAPGGGRDSGLTWAEGTLWVGQFRDRTIIQIDPEDGAVLKTLRSDRFVTGVTFVDGELWHGTLENESSELRRIDPHSGAVLQSHPAPPGVTIAGLSSDGQQFFCGSGYEGRVRTIARPETTSE
ncbi:MAG: glutamine cyclotransferase [Myxococcota bacterium]